MNSHRVVRNTPQIKTNSKPDARGAPTSELPIQALPRSELEQLLDFRISDWLDDKMISLDHTVVECDVRFGWIITLT